MTPPSPERAHTSRDRGSARLALGLVLLVVLAVLAPASPPASGQESDPANIDPEALRAEYENLVGDEAQTLVDYDIVSARLAELLVEVQAADQRKRSADAALLVAQADLEDRRDDQTAAEDDLAAARAQVREAERLLRLHAIESYMGDGALQSLASFAEMLDGDDEALARRGYRESISIQQKDLVDQLATARDASARAAGRAETAAEEAQDLRDRVAQLQAASADALAESTRLAEETATERARQGLILADIQSKMVSLEARIVSLDRAADGIAQLLAAYQADEPDPIPSQLHIRSPAPGFPISSEFGPRMHPILNFTRLHAGVDISPPFGHPVLAAADGVVLLAEVRGGYGNTVVIAHGNSLGTVYAHNSEILVQVGDQVKQGDEIAKVGSTGLSTGPHIHFETRVRGVPVNPRGFLPPEDQVSESTGG